MNAPSIVALLLLASAVCGVLGYLYARNRTNIERSLWRDELNTLQTTLKLAEEQREQARARSAELQTERDDARRSLHERETAWTEQTTKLQAATKRIGDLEGELKAAQEKLRQAESDIALLTKSVEASRQQLYERDNDLDRAGKLEAELRAVIEQQKQLINEHKTNLTKLHAERATLERQQAEVAAAREQLDRIREEHSRLQAEQIQAVVTEMLATSQEKLVTAADDKLGAAARAVTDKLREMEQHLREFDTNRTSTEAQLREQIQKLADEHVQGRRQTEALVAALRKPQVRGQWGELQLKRAVELANMREHCDFEEQVQVPGDETVLRPDMVVHMTSGRNVVIDAKVSLEAFLSALEATDDAERDRLMAEHARQVRKHVDSLASKEYFEKVAGSPDFVLMFLPNEALLQAALDKDPTLYEYAFEKSIIIASPTILIPMLRTIELSWAETAVKEHAQRVHELGREIHKRLGTLSGHLNKLGRALDASVKAYNGTIGSLERNVLPAARRFTELKVMPQDLPEPHTVESTTRELKAPELVQAAASEPPLRAVEAAEPGAELA